MCIIIGLNFCRKSRNGLSIDFTSSSWSNFSYNTSTL